MSRTDRTRPDGAAKPLPRPTPVSRPFWEAVHEERVVIQRCRRCHEWIHYPRARCPGCGCDDLAFEPVDGHGVVHTYTVAHRPTAPPFADEVPQILAIVALPQGVRVSTTLVGVAPDAVRVGLPVVPVFDHVSDATTLLRYRPA